MKEYKEIQIDLFKLHDPIKDNTLKKCIVAKGKDLKGEIDFLLKILEKQNISRYKLSKYLKEKFKISDPSAQRLVYLKKEWYPLFYPKELLRLTKRNKEKFKLQNKIEHLKANNPPSKTHKSIKKLTSNLCKIAGAHAADGTLRNSYIAITDYYKSNIKALQKWIKEEFNIQFPIRKKKNSTSEYYLAFHDKVISRYLTKILNFPNGSKTYTFKEPKIIKNSNKQFRKAYAKAVLMFEGGIGIKEDVQLGVKNEDFKNSIAEILNMHNINFKNKEDCDSNGIWRIWSGKLKKESAKEWLSFFEENTEKWYQIYEIINGYQGKIKSRKEAINILNSIYPKRSKKASLLEIFFIIKNLNKTHRYEIVKKLCKNNKLKSYGGKWAHSLMPYLNILKKAKIITVEKARFGPKKSFGTIIRDLYTYNSNIKEWKVPYRPWLEKEIDYLKN